MTRLSAARGLIALALLAATVAALHPRAASADVIITRIDSVVQLSNHSSANIGTEIRDSARDISSLQIALHVPAGTSALSVSSSDGALASAADVTVISDAAPGQYYSTTNVTSGTPGVPVTASLSVGPQGSSSSSGTSGADIVASISR